MRNKKLPNLLLLSVLLQTSFSCGSGQNDDSIPVYYQQIRLLMEQNGDLSERFIQLTGELFSGSESEDAASALQSNIIPLSSQLASAASNLTSTNAAIAATHEYLIEGWTQRQESYTEMLQAYRSSDPALFESASSKAELARSNEERYFSEINTFLAPYGLSVIQHPW